MNSRIWYVGEYSVQPGKVAEFKRLMQSVIDQEHSEGTDVLVYEFFFDDHESKFHAIESFQDSDGVLRHLERCGEAVTKVLEISDLTRFEIYGNASEALRDALAPFGAKIVPTWAGFTRPA